MVGEWRMVLVPDGLLACKVLLSWDFQPQKHLQGLQRMVPKRGNEAVSQRQLCEGKGLVDVRGQTVGGPQKGNRN